MRDIEAKDWHPGVSIMCVLTPPITFTDREIDLLVRPHLRVTEELRGNRVEERKADKSKPTR